ncbi:MAG: oligosaccharide flippase family protein [Acidobacteria bacterium]|nr:oligosaccharide flippase family protein [Acidobacteriota bacterium]
MAQSQVIKPPPDQTADVAKTAGRGTILITLAKLWFMISGYGISFALPRLISKDEFGLYKIVIGVVSIINAVIVTGTQQTVSKYISQEESKADAVKAKALRLQTLVGGAAALGFFLLAPLIARYLHDERLTNYLRVASLITLSYGFYAVFIGYFNGRKDFLKQALLDVAYSTMKLGYIVLFVGLGFGVMGGVGGFALAAASVLALSVMVAGRGRREGEVPAAELLKFQAYLLGFTLLLNLLQKVDLVLIKALSSADATIASENAAYYGAALDLANLTYQIIISITFVIFPLISQATFAAERAKTQSYIANTLRYTLMIMAGLATLFSANARGALAVVYPADYQAGGAALRVVAFGMLFFGMLYVLTTIISASGEPKVSLLIGALTLLLSAALNYLLIPLAGLRGAATATTVAMCVGAVGGAAYLAARFQAFLPWLSALRITACAALVYALSLSFSPAAKIWILIKLAVLGLVYVTALLVSREIGRDDVAILKRIIKK